MAYSEAGSSSDAAQVSGGKYQVSLNFRGPDTRYGFTDFLYHGLINVGVRVFMDNEKLSVREAIGGDLLHAIDDPIIYIPIFSRTYASSIWCLRELRHIVDNVSMSKGTKSIFPVFFGVKPDDVKLKTPLYEDALLKHKELFPDEVERWRAALAEVGGIKGWHWDGNQSPALIVESIVDKVLVKLATRKKVVTEHLVGLDDQIKELTELLDVDHPNVQLIGIYGMGGIGKTTVAKVVFNTLSSHFGNTCCFLENVRECSLTKGIVELQKNLLSDIVGIKPMEIVNNYEHGMMMIEEVLSTKKVLVILDDVAEKWHIEYLIGRRPLAPGSRIIITTRDQTIMPGKWFNSDIRRYEIPKMDDAVALQLFCRHAFDRDFPLNDYRKLSNEIVSTTEQLPLAIEVIGSLLKGQGKEFWQGMLVNLRNAPNREVRKKLQISYDGLDKFEKQIFLDIACFFFNEKKTNAIYAWDDCRLDPIIGINILTQKCLIKVLDNGKLWMHNQLIALGRQIVREDSQGDLKKQSRLWIAKEAMKIMGTLERKDKVEALDIDGLDDFVEIRNEEFERFQNLRLLKLGNGTCTGDFAKCCSKLRWISWRSPHQGFKANNMHLDYLLVFKLDKNGFTDDSKAWDLIKRAHNLKVLSLVECHGITTTPDFSKSLGLERLTLASCSRLKEIESFIGYLPSLIELEIEECKGLTVLPEEVGALGKLERFSLLGCSRLRELPSSIGNITTLIELNLSYTGIIKLPNSIQDLVKLESFLLRDTRLTELPASIEKLKSLRVLCLSISGLSPLEHVWQLPSGIDMLKNLEELDLSRCVEMKGEISVGIRELSSLAILNLRDCHGIQVLPELPTSLTFLFLQSKSLLSVPNLSNLTNLVELLLSDDSRNTGKSNLLPSCDLRWIGRLSRLKKLELNLLNVLAPQELASLSHLEELTLCYLDLETLVQLPSSHWSLENLSTLEFYRCEVEAIPLEKLPRLKKLNIDGCKQLERLYIPLELRKLRQAWVSLCPKLVEIQVLGLSTSLKSLRVSGCESLIRIGGLSNLKNLEELVIQQCNVLINVEGLRELESLKSLDVKECMSLTKVIDAFCTNIPDDCLVEISGCGDFIKRGATSLKHYKEETLMDKPNKRMKKMEDDGREQPADGETSDRNYCAIAAVQNVVGIDDRAKQIIDLLEMEVNDEVCIIGIYGIDGIGKTTLAKAVYDQISSCFDSCSFLAEVEETTQNSHGIQFLQNKLICDILKRDREDFSFDERIEDFLDIFREMKVLIVVDDVEKPTDLRAIVGEHLHWFGPGTRIIVTSKNSGILKEYDPEKACNYMISELDDGQAFELFCKHAFGMQSSLPDYEGFSNRIVNDIEKLPLAIEVISSFLRGKSIREWEKMEKSMKERLMSSEKTTVGLKEILDICYKELDQQQKDIFLDIACFISDVDARIVSYMWPTCCLPSSDCILMPLAKIGENNELQMHRLLRYLGKIIFKQEGSGDPSSRRFCTQDMVLKAMDREKGTENVEACDSRILTAASLASMPAISFLKLDDAKVSGDFAGAFPSLRWLRWQRCALEFDAINFVLRELVILDLSWSKVTEDWGGWTEIKMEKLRVLNLTSCFHLPITPDFSGYKDLEILILERCSRLVKLHPSIGHLKRLVSLNLKCCSRLSGLPEELGCMTALKELFVDGTCVRQIPISIGNLKQLEILSGFECFPLTHLPSSICYLTALSELSLDGAKITELPSSLGEPLKLRRLSLRHCRYLEELPDSIGEMVLLEELDISATSISEIPDSIRNLKSLKVLRMDSSFIRKFPREIGNLTNLEELHASWCRNLNGAIPSDIKGLCHLRSLKLGHSSISSLPPEISTISGLLTLDLIQCNEIEELPKLPPSLICLRVSSKRMKAIPHLEDLKELEELCLSDVDPKACRPPSKWPMLDLSLSLKCPSVKQVIDKPSFSISFPKLRRLELSLSQVIKLKFEPTDIPHWPTLPGLSHKEVSELPKTLLAFKLCHSAVEEIEGLERLKALKRLDISNCKIEDLCGIGRLTSLRSLILSDCDYLDRLPDLSNLKSLKVLEIRRCKMIHQIEGMEKLTSLKELNISECPAENTVQIQNSLEDVRVRSVERWGRGDLIKQTATSVKRDRKEILLDTSDKRMKKMEDEARERPADVETSNRNCYAIATVQNVVEIDDRAKQITDLLEMEVNDEVRIIGIYGTDGIGKTTLAKAVYKRISSCFDSCSFLAEVEETTQNSHGIQLQNKLIHDILERDQEDLSFHERIEDFLDIFREMKVLIVVDDVEKPSDLHAVVGNQLDWFGPGSRIIVTSKNSGILEDFDSDKARNHTVSELDDGQAFGLFCKHAFRMQSSIPDYDELSNRIVNAIEKLPLAIEVVGSFLRGKSIQEWIKMEKSMKARPMSSLKTTVGLQELLDICYRELDHREKDIFLDIAYFISGVDARIASYMWPNFYPSSGCILVPLAKIGENNELQMHRLLRRLGKKMFEQEGSGDPIGRKFYIQEKGIENVEALCLDFTAGDFQMMPELRFLKLDNAKVSGNFEGALASLRWLCWQRCPLDFSAKNFLLTELVILDLSWSKVTEEWGGWSEIKMKKLKVLNLTGCSDLLFTPDFSGYEYLEILILERCSHLVKLDPSIGNLKRLVSLNLKFCSQLNGLPAELGRMTALKELFIDGTSVRQIPISIGNLKQLEILSGLNCFPFTHLPSSICNLTALSEFSLEGAKISKLPSSLGKLQKLRRLSLRDCRCLEKLPYSIGEIGSLEELDISATSVSELPDSVGNLKSLKVLRMDSSFIRAFPGQIGYLTKLEELHASWCWSLKGAIPHDIKGLHCLRSLTLGHSSISSLPPAISTIRGLHTLDLIQCDEIEELPKLPPSLICLRVSSERMKAIPLLEDLKELEELCLSDGDWEARQPPSKLPMPESNVKRMIDKQSFSISFPRLRKLELSLSQVIKLKFGPTDIPPLKRLKMLTPPGLSCRDVSELPKKLLSFKLYHSAIEEIEGLEGLEALKRLDISNCKIQNLNGIGQITSLRSLILSDCDDLSLPDLSNLKSLKVLEIIRCKKISQIEGLEKLTSLEKLNISECPAEKSAQVQDALKYVMARFPNT